MDVEATGNGNSDKIDLRKEEDSWGIVHRVLDTIRWLLPTPHS